MAGGGRFVIGPPFAFHSGTGIAQSDARLPSNCENSQEQAMSSNVVSVRAKKVPTLYEADESKYVGPHRWQIQGWAGIIRRLWERRAYTRWVDAACSEIQVAGLEHLDGLRGRCVFVANHSSHLLELGSLFGVHLWWDAFHKSLARFSYVDD